MKPDSSPPDLTPGTSDRLEITIADLLGLIDGLDRIDDDDYLDLTRWNRQGSGEDGGRLTLVTRQLARERLGCYPSEDIGDEVLRQIDLREPRHAL